MDKLLNFLKELPTIYLVFICFIILIIGFFSTQDQNLFTLANLALGAIIGIARGKGGSPESINQDTEVNLIPPKETKQDE